MDIEADIARVKDLLEKAQEVAIVTHENPTFDSLGSSLALSLGLISLGKKVTVACPDPITVELASFVGVDRVTTELGKKNFIISLDYMDGSIEKVSYNIEGDKFNLVIEHRPGFEPFSPDKVHYTYDGAGSELIFAVDTIHLGGLKKLYEGNKGLYADKPVVNIDRHPNNTHFGQVNLIDPTASSTAELVAQLLSGLGVSLNPDIATNLLNALFGATNFFQNPNVTPMAFELAGVCIRAGGLRFAKLPTGEAKPRPMSPPPTPLAPAPAPKPTPPPTTPKGPTPPSPGAPADWLKPKIFKSSSLV